MKKTFWTTALLFCLLTTALHQVNAGGGKPHKPVQKNPKAGQDAQPLMDGEAAKHQEKLANFAYNIGFPCDFVYVESTRHPGLLLQGVLHHDDGSQKDGKNQSTWSVETLPLVDAHGQVAHSIHIKSLHPDHVQEVDKRSQKYKSDIENFKKDPKGFKPDKDEDVENLKLKYKLVKPSERPPRRVHIYSNHHHVLSRHDAEDNDPSHNHDRDAFKYQVVNTGPKLPFSVFGSSVDLVSVANDVNKFRIRSVDYPSHFLTVENLGQQGKEEVRFVMDAKTEWHAKVGTANDTFVIATGDHYLHIAHSKDPLDHQKAQNKKLWHHRDLATTKDASKATNFFVITSSIFSYYYGHIVLVDLDIQVLMNEKIEMHGDMLESSVMGFPVHGQPEGTFSRQMYVRPSLYAVQDITSYSFESVEFPGHYLVSKGGKVVFATKGQHEKDLAPKLKKHSKGANEFLLDALWTVKVGQCEKQIYLPPPTHPGEHVAHEPGSEKFHHHDRMPNREEEELQKENDEEYETDDDVDDDIEEIEEDNDNEL